VADLENLLNRNRIFMDRTQGIGVLTHDEAIAWSTTGPMATRRRPVKRDPSQGLPYLCYADNWDGQGAEAVKFQVPITTGGDACCRYLVRVEELKQSIKIIEQLIDRIPRAPPTSSPTPRWPSPTRREVYGSIEGLVHHFEIIMTNRGWKAPIAELYSAAGPPTASSATPSSPTAAPVRRAVHVRPPCFINCTSFMAKLSGRPHARRHPRGDRLHQRRGGPSSTDDQRPLEPRSTLMSLAPLIRVLVIVALGLAAAVFVAVSRRGGAFAPADSLELRNTLSRRLGGRRRDPVGNDRAVRHRPRQHRSRSLRPRHDPPPLFVGEAKGLAAGSWTIFAIAGPLDMAEVGGEELAVGIAADGLASQDAPSLHIHAPEQTESPLTRLTAPPRRNWGPSRLPLGPPASASRRHH
jgi:hypothetical protein